MGPSAEVHCAARAAERVQRSRNAFSSITMTKPVACRGTPLYHLYGRPFTEGTWHTRPHMRSGGAGAVQVGVVGWDLDSERTFHVFHA